jgi:hypothetical protein
VKDCSVGSPGGRICGFAIEPHQEINCLIGIVAQAGMQIVSWLYGQFSAELTADQLIYDQSSHVFGRGIHYNNSN